MYSFESIMFQIGVVIEDKEFVESSMNGMKWMAGKFSYSLRCSLWSEHLGLHAGEVIFKKFLETPILYIFDFRNLYFHLSIYSRKLFSIFTCFCSVL